MLLYFQLSIVKSKVPFSVISSGKKLNDDCNLLEKREGKAQLPSWNIPRQPVEQVSPVRERVYDSGWRSIARAHVHVLLSVERVWRKASRKDAMHNRGRVPRFRGGHSLRAKRP